MMATDGAGTGAGAMYNRGTGTMAGKTAGSAGNANVIPGTYSTNGGTVTGNGQPGLVTRYGSGAGANNGQATAQGGDQDKQGGGMSQTQGKQGGAGAAGKEPESQTAGNRGAGFNKAFVTTNTTSMELQRRITDAVQKANPEVTSVYVITKVR